jgi:hypothetical protein
MQTYGTLSIKKTYDYNPLIIPDNETEEMSEQIQLQVQEQIMEDDNPFSKACAILSFLLIITYGLFVIIDYQVNRNFYFKYDQLFYRNASIFLIMLLCWLILLYPLYALLVYLRRQQRQKYERFCTVKIFDC